MRSLGHLINIISQKQKSKISIRYRMYPNDEGNKKDSKRRHLIYIITNI